MNAFRPERAHLLHEVRATVRLALPLIAAQLAAVGWNGCWCCGRRCTCC